MKTPTWCGGGIWALHPFGELKCRRRHLSSRAAFVTLLITASLLPLRAQQPAALQAQVPFDAAVRTGKLPNGITYFVRKNARPANRVLLRLPRKTGSLYGGRAPQGRARC